MVAGEGFRFGRERAGDLGLLRQLGFDVRPVPLAEGISSSHIRQLLRAGEVEAAARLLGRPAEVEGVVVGGRRSAAGRSASRPRTSSRRRGCSCRRTASTRAPRPATRAAISIGTNPQYGGTERRIEAFLLDFEGDLYGQRLVVELWRRLRDEAVFESEQALVDQIARDVELTRAAERPG